MSVAALGSNPRAITFMRMDGTDVPCTGAVNKLPILSVIAIQSSAAELHADQMF